MQEYKGYPLKLFLEGLQELLLGAWDIQTKASICRQADQHIKNFLEKDMAPFKVGDKVKCIKPKSDVHPDYDVCGVGVYTVASVEKDCSGGYFIRLKGGPTFGLKHNRFELVTEGHPHAILMARYAEVAKDHSEPWQFFQFRYRHSDNWVTMRRSPTWSPKAAYREKPKEVTASMWVAYVVHVNSPKNIRVITSNSRENLVGTLSKYTRDMGYQVVKGAHEVTETYEEK